MNWASQQDKANRITIGVEFEFPNGKRLCLAKATSAHFSHGV